MFYSGVSKEFESGKLFTYREWKEVAKVDQLPSIHMFSASDCSIENYVINFSQYFSRYGYIENCCFPIITSECVDVLADILKSKNVVDAGSGRGYLSKLLLDRGIRIQPFDECSSLYGEPIWTDVIKANVEDATDLIGSADAVILSWPSLETDFGLSVVSKMSHDSILIYQGESSGGCCANDAFFEYLSEKFYSLDWYAEMLNKHHITFFGLHDYWHMFRKG